MCLVEHDSACTRAPRIDYVKHNFHCDESARHV
jgi:hypothetical protein